MNLQKYQIVLCVFVLSTLALTISIIAVIFVAKHAPNKSTKHTDPKTFTAEITKLFQDLINLKKSEQFSDTSKRYAYQINKDAVIAQVGIRAPAGHNNEKLDFSNSHPIVAPVRFNVNESHQLVRGVGFKSDGLIIVKPGLYYVYISAKFLISKTVSCSEQYSQFFLYVMKIPANDAERTETIIRVAHTCVQGTSQGGLTKHNGRIVSLDAGEIIQVQLSGKGFLDYNQQQTYLGIFKLS